MHSSAFKPSRPPLRALLPALVVLPSVALILSFFMSWATVGFSPEFLSRWGRSFLTTLLAMPIVLALLSVLETQLNKVIGELPWVARKLVLSVVAACVIETLIACAVTAINQGFGDFAGNWWLAFSRSLPAGLAIGLFMSFYMKPRMERMRQSAITAAVA